MDYLSGVEIDATHCHLPVDDLTHVSPQRSLALTAFPFPSVPLPAHDPVTIAESPCGMTFMSLSSWLTHLDFLTFATTSALLSILPSESMPTKLSANSAPTPSPSLAFDAF